MCDIGQEAEWGNTRKSRNGEGEDSDQKDRQLNKQTSDVLKEEKWIAEEG